MIRTATWTDIETIDAIYNEAILEGELTGHLEPLSIENIRAWYLEHQNRYAVFVKSADRSVVGYAAISPYRKGRRAFEETCEISCYLAGAYRGRGFGKELIEHAIEHAGLAGFRLVIAAVLGCNQRSVGLLSGLGFSILGKLPNAAKINNTHFDHIYLCRNLRYETLRPAGQHLSHRGAHPALCPVAAPFQSFCPRNLPLSAPGIAIFGCLCASGPG